MPTRPTSDETTEFRRPSDAAPRVEPGCTASGVGPTAGPIWLAANESFEAWPSERTILVAAGDQVAGPPCSAANESSDEIWVSEQTETLRQTESVTEADFVSDFVSEV